MSKTKQLITGPCGNLEIELDMPPASSPWVDSPRALALIAHPHPLRGGDMDNKVTTTLSRVCAGLGCASIRFNYRGVHNSEGTYDASVGEAEDAAAALAWLQHHILGGERLSILLGGFSFGTAVAARLALTLPEDKLLGMVLAGAAVPRFAQVNVNTNITMMIHGELDETMPLSEIMEWTRPQNLPITVVPHADHFFHRQLVPLKKLATRHFDMALNQML